MARPHLLVSGRQKKLHEEKNDAKSEPLVPQGMLRKE
jgi:hypothetical protein